MLKLLVLLVAIASVALAQKIDMGPGCPNPPIMKDIDIAKMAGTWYTAARTPAMLVDQAKCISHSITSFGFGFLISTTYSTTTSNVPVTIMGGGAIVGQSIGQIVVVYPLTKIPVPVPVNFISTDYTTYATAYICLDLSVAHISFAAIYTKEKVPSAATMARAYADFDNAKIDRSQMQIIDQSC